MIVGRGGLGKSGTVADGYRSSGKDSAGLVGHYAVDRSAGSSRVVRRVAGRRSILRARQGHQQKTQKTLGKSWESHSITSHRQGRGNPRLQARGVAVKLY